MTTLKEIMEEIEIFAKEHLVQDFLHGWSHIERVLKYARQINKEMKGNWDIIQSAILLHDIGHKLNREKHNIIGAEMAEEFLLSKGISQEITEKVVSSIITHSRQFAPNKPSFIEAQVVYDADGMDLFGAIGLMRALLTCALRDKGFDCIIKKLKWRLAQSPNFYSKYAKEFVIEHLKIIQQYLNELENQLKDF